MELINRMIMRITELFKRKSANFAEPSSALHLNTAAGSSLQSNRSTETAVQRR